MLDIDKTINFDANASYGLLPEVLEQTSTLLKGCLNPSSIHTSGQRARALIENARQSILQLVGDPQDVRVVFTSGATEANNTALRLPLDHYSKGEIITSQVEHPSILELADSLERTTALRVRRIAPKDLMSIPELLMDDTRLLSCMLANNETGHVYPIERIFNAVKQVKPGLLCHTDAVQGFGKLSLHFEALACDAMTLSGHKIGSLMGVGALLVQERILPAPLMHGGPQEMRWRAGTENVAGIISFSIAAELMRAQQSDIQKKLRTLKKNALSILAEKLPQAQILFQDSGDQFLANTISVRIPGLLADDLVVACDLAGLCVSAGSACASGKPLVSHVLRAYEVSEDASKEVLRISFPHTLVQSELERGLAVLCRAASVMLENEKLDNSSSMVRGEAC